MKFAILWWQQIENENEAPNKIEIMKGMRTPFKEIRARSSEMYGQVTKEFDTETVLQWYALHL